MKQRTKMSKKVVWSIVGLTGALAGAAGASGYILNQALKAKAGLNNFVIIGGKSIDLTKKEKINYVAMGDSMTAGYNGFMGKDYVSFADFFQSDIEKAGKLGTYRNFAKTGDMVWDLEKLATQNSGIMHALKKADLITVTIGANDLLKFIKLLQFPFDTIIGGQQAMQLRINEYRDKFYAQAQTTVNFVESYYLLAKSIDQLQVALKNNDFKGVMSMQKSMQETIFDLIQRNITIFLRDINQVAPNAKVILLGHANPFVNLPPTLLNGQVEANDNFTFKYFFQKYMDSIDASIMNNFSEFIEIGEIPSFKNNNEKTTASDGKTRLRKLPNSMDIHPSTYGHELIGNGLFDILAPELGIKNPSAHHSTGRTPDSDDIANPVNSALEFNPEYFDESASKYVGRRSEALLRDFLRMDSNLNSPNNTLVSKLMDIFTGALAITDAPVKHLRVRLSHLDSTLTGTFTPSATSIYEQVSDGKVSSKGIMDNFIGPGGLTDLVANPNFYMQKAIVELQVLFTAAYKDATLKTKIINTINNIKTNYTLTLTQYNELKTSIATINKETFVYTDATEYTDGKGAQVLTSHYGAKDMNELNLKYMLTDILNALTMKTSSSGALVWDTLFKTGLQHSNQSYFNPVIFATEGGVQEYVEQLSKFNYVVDDAKKNALMSEWNAASSKAKVDFKDWWNEVDKIAEILNEYNEYKTNGLPTSEIRRLLMAKYTTKEYGLALSTSTAALGNTTRDMLSRLEMDGDFIKNLLTIRSLPSSNSAFNDVATDIFNVFNTSTSGSHDSIKELLTPRT